MAPDEDIVIVVTDALSQSGDDDNGSDFLSYIEEVPLLGGDDSSYFSNAVAMDFVVDTSSSPTSSQSAAHTLIGSVTLAGLCGATVSSCHSIYYYRNFISNFNSFNITGGCVSSSEFFICVLKICYHS